MFTGCKRKSVTRTLVARKNVMNQHELYPRALPLCSVLLFDIERSKGPKKFHRLPEVCRHSPGPPRVFAGTPSRRPCNATAAGSRNHVHQEWRHSPGDAGRVWEVAGQWQYRHVMFYCLFDASDEIRILRIFRIFHMILPCFYSVNRG